MTIAQASDVQARLGRPLTPLETARVTALLQDVEVEIQRLAPDRLTDPQWVNAVKSVECSVAIRVSRLGNSVSAEIPQTESIGYPNNPTYQKIELYRSDRRTLGLELTDSVQTAPTPCTDTPPFWDPTLGGGWHPEDWGW